MPRSGPTRLPRESGSGTSDRPAPGKPAAEFEVDEALVRALLADQHPDLAELPLVETVSGWDNRIFRLGDRLAVRLPCRASAADLITSEQVWLPRLAPRLALPVPAPVRVGRPGRGYPCQWSVVPWIRGVSIDRYGLPSAEAPRFAAFLRSLHRAAPADAPSNPLRGVPLARRADSTVERLDRLDRRTSLIRPEIRRIWEEALEAPLDLPPSWIHGDLHPGNVLVEGGAISGIIDWGDLAAGDRATDLASIWLLFDEPDARAAVLEAYPALTRPTLARALGWAVFFAAVLTDAGHVNEPGYAAIGERTLRRLAGA